MPVRSGTGPVGCCGRGGNRRHGIIEAIIRFARPGIEIPDVRIVSRFGAIAFCRIRARDSSPSGTAGRLSLKAARGLSPGFESAQPEIPGPAQPGSAD